MTRPERIVAVAKHFLEWINNRRGVSPLYEALVEKLASDDELLAMLVEVSGRSYLANLFMGAVHFLLLQGKHHELGNFYGTVTRQPLPPGDAYPYFKKFCLENREELLSLVCTRQVQINEVRRCATLLPAFVWVHRQRSDRSLAIIDVGASAGLNMLWDHYCYDFGSAGVIGDPNSRVKITLKPLGQHFPRLPQSFPPVAWRLGVDLNPVDVSDSVQLNWLIALVSPDDDQRLRLLKAALEFARATPVRIVRGDALAVLPSVLAEVPDRAALCIVHSFTWHHFTEGGLAHLEKTLSDYSMVRAFHEISLEWERIDGKPCGQIPVPLTVVSHSQQKRSETLLGRVDPRGSCEWLEWMAEPNKI